MCRYTLYIQFGAVTTRNFFQNHDDVIKWKHFPCYCPFVRGIHRSPVKSPHKGQWRGALMFSSICVLINSWVNNREAGDLRCYCAHYDVIVMILTIGSPQLASEGEWWGVFCDFKIWAVFYVVSHCIQFRVMLDRVITVPDCIANMF